MRLKKLGVEPTVLYHQGNKKSYAIFVYTVGWPDYLKGRLYHFYDMKVPIKVPGYKRVCRVLEKRFGAENRSLWDPDEGVKPLRWRDRFIGWSCEQDMRCYERNYQNRDRLGSVEIDEETYNSVRKLRLLK